MSAPSETQKWTVPSEKIPGVEYDVTSRVIEDACNECGGNGVVRYSTFADYRAYITELNDPSSEDDPIIAESGTRPCERCQGTGVFKGDGCRIEVRMSLSYQLQMTP